MTLKSGYFFQHYPNNQVLPQCRSGVSSYMTYHSISVVKVVHVHVSSDNIELNSQ